jgi:hypothetical protein
MRNKCIIIIIIIIIRTGFNISPLWNEIRQPVPERIWSNVRDKVVTPVVKQGFSIHSFDTFLYEQDVQLFRLRYFNILLQITPWIVAYESFF